VHGAGARSRRKRPFPALDQYQGSFRLASCNCLLEESVMNTLEWSNALLLDYEPMDRLHREFVVLLAQAQQADDAQLPENWAALIDHTAQQFEREDRWMRRTRFACTADHTLQHRVVLNLLRDGLAMTRSGELAAVREMADELAAWFAKHTQSLDAALALHLRREAPAHRVVGRGANSIHLRR
jgi:hemerythrin-like metal-binding protein